MSSLPGHGPTFDRDSTPDSDAATVVMDQAPGPAAPETIGPGSVLGEYELLAVLGTGGCGTVFEARHRAGGKVAIKVLHENVAESREMVERFLREAQAVHRIRHPNIVAIHEVGGLPSARPYLVMELLGGHSLGALLARGALSPAEALEILEPVCAAVDAAHRAGIVHRDLKASNIQIGEEAGVRRITLLDFGIAKLVELDPSAAGLTAMGRKLGTPSSMSPEQIRGAVVDHRTDIYALGVLLFGMLTCRYPFEAPDSFEVERMHLERPPPRPSELVGVGLELDAVVLRCLAKGPADRFQTVPELLEALRAAVGRGGWSAPPARALRPALAGAILVEVTLSDEAQDALDDAVLIDLSCALERAEQLLVEAGLRVALQTASAAVGVTVLSSDAAEQQVERARLVDQAARLHRALDQRAGKQAGVGVTVCVHIDQALVGERESGEQEVIGPILSLGGWMPPTSVGLFATAGATEGLTEIADTFTRI